MAKSVRSRAVRALVTLALAVCAAFVVVLPARPAAAASGQLCLPLYGSGGMIVDWICVPIEVVECPPPCGPWAIDLKERLVLPYEQEFGYVDALGNGLQLVSSAAAERDPAVAAGLLDQAEQQLLLSARILDGTGVSLGDVGLADLRGNQVRPDPSLGWLEAAGTDVGNGIWQMQVALVRPDPDPWIEAGMRSFISANQHLAYGR